MEISGPAFFNLGQVSSSSPLVSPLRFLTKFTKFIQRYTLIQQKRDTLAHK